MNNTYIGVDSSKKSIDYCIDHHDGLFYHADAEKYIDAVESINPIFLFSLDYMSINTIRKYLEKTDKVFMAVHYNKPYLSPTSVYSLKEDVFKLINPPEKRFELYKLFQEYDAETFKLFDQDYYFVTIIKKGEQ